MCLTTRTMNMVQLGNSEEICLLNFIPPDIRTVSAEWLSLHQHDSGISSSQQQIPLDRPIATNCYSYHDTSRFDDFIAESEATEDAAKLLNIVSVKVCASTCMFKIQKNFINGGQRLSCIYIVGLHGITSQIKDCYAVQYISNTL